MMQNDNELQATQERIILFERILAEARKTYSISNYQAIAEGYLSELDRLRGDSQLLEPNAGTGGSHLNNCSPYPLPSRFS